MNTLPAAKKVFAEVVEGKKVQKQVYDDGSCSIIKDDTAKRYFDNGIVQTYKKLSPEAQEFILVGEERPDGSRRGWHANGEKEYETYPDGTAVLYDTKGKITYHATEGVEDTETYLENRKKSHGILRNIAALKNLFKTR